MANLHQRWRGQQDLGNLLDYIHEQLNIEHVMYFTPENAASAAQTWSDVIGQTADRALTTVTILYNARKGGPNSKIIKSRMMNDEEYVENEVKRSQHQNMILFIYLLLSPLTAVPKLNNLTYT